MFHLNLIAFILLINKIYRYSLPKSEKMLFFSDFLRLWLYIRVVRSNLISKSTSIRFAKLQVGLESVCDFLNRLLCLYEHPTLIGKKSKKTDSNRFELVCKYASRFEVGLEIRKPTSNRLELSRFETGLLNRSKNPTFNCKESYS